MTIRLVLFCALFVAVGNLAAATPTAEVAPGVIAVSASAHSIHQGADAHSQIFEADFGVTRVLGITAELARVTDDSGRTDIGSVYFRRPFGRTLRDRPQVAGYAGVTWLAVEPVFGGRAEETGPAIGLVADLPVKRDLTFYGRAGVAVLDKSLWTLDFGVRYEVRPRWFLSLGYRSYDVKGTSLGGFLVGATYR